MKSILCIAALLMSLALPAKADFSDITDIQVIPLKFGVNDISRLTLDGRDGQIIKAWRNDANGSGFAIYLVMVDGKSVGVGADKFQDFVTDQPYTPEHTVKSVRFARGKVSGQPELLLITARRDFKPDATFADPAIVMFDIYHVMPNGAAGTTGDYFTPISEFPSKKKFCNSDLALAQDMGLPLPDPYEGLNKDDGCL